MLAVRGLTGPAGAPLIHDITLDVRAEETVVLLGPIQSGKSTLLRHLVALERPADGTVDVGGHRLADTTEPDPLLVRWLRRRIGVVFESPALLRHSTVIENVELPLLEHTDVSGSAAREAARELLHEVGVHADEDTMPHDLGRADQRRAALARALALQPVVLLLDEPTIGLDPQAAHEFDDTVEMLQARRGFGVLVLTREVRHAYGPGRRVIVLADGRVVAEGDREALLASDHPAIRRLLHRRARS